jgi:hypothetical protein
MPEQWIHIRNWQKFQHYKDRQPSWIKVYCELLDDPNFLALTAGERALLLCLWLQFARGRHQVPLSSSWCRAEFHMKVTRGQLEALNHAGFIEFSASKVLASRARSREVDKDVDLKLLDERVLKTSRSRSEEHDDDAKTFDFDKILRDLP